MTYSQHTVDPDVVNRDPFMMTNDQGALERPRVSVRVCWPCSSPPGFVSDRAGLISCQQALQQQVTQHLAILCHFNPRCEDERSLSQIFLTGLKRCNALGHIFFGMFVPVLFHSLWQKDWH